MNADRPPSSYDCAAEVPEAVGGLIGLVFDLSVHGELVERIRRPS